MNRRFRLAGRSSACAPPGSTPRRTRWPPARARSATRWPPATPLVTRLGAAVPPVRATAEQPAHAGSHRDLLRDRLADAERNIIDAEREVERALGGWRAARAELRAVEALHERHRAAVAAADARAEQRVLDDLAAQAAGAAPAERRRRPGERHHGDPGTGRAAAVHPRAAAARHPAEPGRARPRRADDFADALAGALGQAQGATGSAARTGRAPMAPPRRARTPSRSRDR